MLRERGLPPRHRHATTGWRTSSTCSRGSGYAAGYYVYLWAEVLDADGFDAFVEAGDPFDAAVAARLRRYIYSTGNSVEPGAAFRAFRGRDPVIEPLLRQKGLVAA